MNGNGNRRRRPAVIGRQRGCAGCYGQFTEIIRIDATWICWPAPAVEEGDFAVVFDPSVPRLVPPDPARAPAELPLPLIEPVDTSVPVTSMR